MDGNENRYQNKIITIPNILSFFRLCLIPLIVWLYCFEDRYILALVFLGVSGLTDIVDGAIARKFNMVSDFGKAFDPIADKLTQLAMLICLVSDFPWMMIPIVILSLKEIVSGILALLAIRKTGEVLGAVWHGKANTVLLYSTIVIHLAWHSIPHMLSYAFTAICTVMMLFSAIMYCMNNINILRKGEHKK